MGPNWGFRGSFHLSGIMGCFWYVKVSLGMAGGQGHPGDVRLLAKCARGVLQDHLPSPVERFSLARMMAA
jgi:hypothetical protein